MIKIAPDWTRILRYAWSAWLLSLAVVLGAADITLSQFPELVTLLPFPVPDGLLPWLQAAAAVGGLVARVLVQQDLEAGDDQDA